MYIGIISLHSVSRGKAHSPGLSLCLPIYGNDKAWPKGHEQPNFLVAHRYFLDQEVLLSSSRNPLVYKKSSNPALSASVILKSPSNSLLSPRIIHLVTL